MKINAATPAHRPSSRRAPKPSGQTHPELAPSGTPPRVAVAPGVLDRAHTVIRSDDDTDEDYDARRRVFAAALSYARKD